MAPPRVVDRVVLTLRAVCVQEEIQFMPGV